ncbi:MAG: fatty acid desaturase [Ignavibacteriales bacterium]|nr:MAG: fatty acid desaturase [Ignavibacteriales bacterium]
MLSFENSEWKKIVVKYYSPHTWKSTWQLINSFSLFIITWILMFLSLEINYILTLLLAFPAAGLMARIFIIQHDCGHGSFFKSRKTNDFWGMVCSVFTFTPYHYWRRSHAIHHASAGKLEQRGIGDIYTMTVNEYLSRHKWGRFKYRLYRNPVFLFIIIPTLLFLIVYRFPNYKQKELKTVYSSTYYTSLVIALLIAGMIWLVGWKAFLLIQLPITIVTSSLGAWLFFVQHQFEDTYWAENNEWDYTKAALSGSSYYKLPKILQWFTGNIGFHHIHHLSPRIPNYRLEKCHKENPILQTNSVLTLRKSLKSIFLSLWDEKKKKLVSFRYLKKLQVE